MVIKETIYFDEPGAKNTDHVILSAKKRLQELDIRHVVVASTSGATALKVWEALQDIDVSIVCVGEHYGFWGGDEQLFSEETRKELESKGVKVFIGSHALSGVGRSITNKFKGISHTEIIAHTLRQFGEGLKVCVEISIMAADAGLIPTDREVVAIGGTSKGADTAIVLKAAHMHNYFDLEIREIIAKPRQLNGK
ncbi:MAG TPA: pyruvate kinase alpha/beta domain-containing protein [bacterium]